LFSINRFGNERFLSVYKREYGQKQSSQPDLCLSEDSKELILRLTKYLRQNTRSYNRNEFTESGSNSRSNRNYKSGRLLSVEPNVPEVKFLNSKSGYNYQKFRQELPIYRYRDDIVNCIASNPVVIISGDTGCGKTTQVPQYLLEYCGFNNIKCRIVCAEPRRLAAISVSERISVERNETLGQTVGYQIRLESK